MANINHDQQVQLLLIANGDGIIVNPVWSQSDPLVIDLLPSGATCIARAKGIGGSSVVTVDAENSSGQPISDTEQVTVAPPPPPPATSVVIVAGTPQPIPAGAAYTTAAAGNWSAGATWVGGVAPNLAGGDTVTINHPVTVDVDAIIGNSPAANGPAVITTTANLTVAAGVAFTVRGPVALGNAKLILEAGSTWEFDSSQAASPAGQCYQCNFSGFSLGNREIVVNGTQANQVTIRSNSGGGNGYFSEDAGYGPSTGWSGTYANFSRIGDAAHPAVRLNGGSYIHSLSHFAFDADCGQVQIVQPTSAGGWAIHDCKFCQTNLPIAGTGHKQPLSIGASATAGTITGTRQIFRCSFDEMPALVGQSAEYVDNYFANGWDNAGHSEPWAGMVGSFLRITGPSQGVGGNVNDSAVCFDAGLPISDSGTATAGGATTLTDSGKAWTANAWAASTANTYSVEIAGGTGAGQRRFIVSNTATELTVAYRWDTNPDATSTYQILADIYNPHGLQPSAGIATGSLDFSGNVFQNVGCDTQGDCLLHVSNDLPTTIRNNIVLPNAMGDSTGTLLTLSGSGLHAPNGDAGPFTIEHNTCHSGAQAMVAISEGGTNPTATIPFLRSNLAWNESGRTYFPHGGTIGPYFVGDTDNANDPSANPNADIIAPGGATNNCIGQGIDPGQAGGGFNVELTGGPAGTNTFGVDPQFVDSSRSLWTWATIQGSTAVTVSGRLADAMGYIRANPALTRTSLIPYIKAGFTPTNPALLNAGHDGATIGAVQ